MTATLTVHPIITTITTKNPPAAPQCGLNKTRICCKESDTPQTS
jgi:hypothetical protein